MPGIRRRSVIGITMNERATSIIGQHRGVGTEARAPSLVGDGKKVIGSVSSE